MPPHSTPPASPLTRLWPLTASTLVLLPWLNPFTLGPTSPALQWFATLAAIAGLLLLGAVWRVAAPLAPAPWAPAVAGAWLLAGVLSSLMGLVQYLGFSAAWVPWIDGNEAGRAFANLRQPNQFATLTNMALVAVCWWGVRGAAGSGGQASAGVRWGGLALAAVLAAGNAASSSRTGLLQLVLLWALAAAWGGWRHVVVRRVLLTAVGAYCVALVVLPLLVGLNPLSAGALARLQQGDDLLCGSRRILWANVLHLIQLRPLQGWGWGELDYAHYMTLYPGPRFCAILDNAHNLPLQVAVELGLPAALLLCAGVLWWVLRARPWRETDATRQMAWAVLALIGLHSLLEYPLWYGPFLMALGLCVLLLWRRAPIAPHPARWPAVVQAGLGGALALATAFMAWDYYRVSQLYLAPEARNPAYRYDTAAKVGGSWLFPGPVGFAQLTTTPLTRANAAVMYSLAEDMLHYSPEPRVIETLIESAALLGLDEVAAAHIRRYRAAFPSEYVAWSRLNAAFVVPLQ